MRIRDAGFRIVIVPCCADEAPRGGSTAGLWLPARIELKRSEYQLLEKRLGKAIRCFAITRDVLCEAGQVRHIWPCVSVAPRGLGLSSRLTAQCFAGL